MPCKLFVANFPYSTTDDELSGLFGPHGQVLSVKVATDRETGRSRGFGFVEMGSEQEADNAIRELDGFQIGGRSLAVRVAEERARPGGPGAGHGGRVVRVRMAAATAPLAARVTTWVALAAVSAAARVARARVPVSSIPVGAAASPPARRGGQAQTVGPGRARLTIGLVLPT